MSAPMSTSLAGGGGGRVLGPRAKNVLMERKRNRTRASPDQPEKIAAKIDQANMHVYMVPTPPWVGCLTSSVVISGSIVQTERDVHPLSSCSPAPQTERDVRLSVCTKCGAKAKWTSLSGTTPTTVLLDMSASPAHSSGSGATLA